MSQANLQGVQKILRETNPENLGLSPLQQKAEHRTDTVLTYRECLAMRLLADSDWTVGELKMTFMIGEDAVRDHINEDCHHTQFGIRAEKTPLNADTIKQWREDAGLSQQDFGKKIGVSGVTISRWENGVHEPSPEASRRLREWRVFDGR